MFCDKSFAQSSQVFGEFTIPFERQRIRQVLVQKNLNTVIGMGGEKRDLVHFKLKWHHTQTETAAAIMKYGAVHCGLVEHPRLARTPNNSSTDLLSQLETRPRTLEFPQLKMRYVKGDRLGSGQFGEVHRAINADSGKFMAVKTLRRPTKQEDWTVSVYYALKREVKVLSKINHPHIIDYITSQGWGGPKVEIFMGLKEGTLDSLIRSGEDARTVTEFVFPQMLQALDYLDWNGIIHRDVKPENILYTSQPGRQFQLADFGLCNLALNATSPAGTEIYMAPEMFRKGAQTSKVDVWSLFVTILWTLDIGGFRRPGFASPDDAQAAVAAASSNGRLLVIREMSIIEPELRASAAQMLVKCFGGVGLSTPRNQVPPLSFVSSYRSKNGASSSSPYANETKRGCKKEGVSMIQEM